MRSHPKWSRSTALLRLMRVLRYLLGRSGRKRRIGRVARGGHCPAAFPPFPINNLSSHPGRLHFSFCRSATLELWTMSDDTELVIPKRKRVTVACDGCRFRKTKVRPRVLLSKHICFLLTVVCSVMAHGPSADGARVMAIVAPGMADETARQLTNHPKSWTILSSVSVSASA